MNVPGIVPFTTNENVAVPPGGTMSSCCAAGRSGVGQPSARNARSGEFPGIPSRASCGVPFLHAVDPVLRSTTDTTASSFAFISGYGVSDTKLAWTVALVGGAQRLVSHMKCGQSQVGPGSV